MRTAVTTILLVLIAWGHVTTAQKLRLVPQTGFDKIRTNISQNDGSFTSLKNCITSNLGLRMEYNFRKGHGPYVELLTNRSIVGVDFATKESGVQQETVSRGDKRYSIGAGYQLNSKAIQLTKSKASSPKEITGSSYKKQCIGYTSRCGQKKEIKNVRSQNNGWTMRVQPALGAAYIPRQEDVVHQTGAFRYNAGNTNVAIISRLGFEFAKNRQSVIMLAVVYQKGIGNLDEVSVSSTTGTKTNVTRLNSKTSSWGFTAGIPITLYKKKPPVKKYMMKITERKTVTEKKSSSPSKCQQYKSNCGQKTKSL